MSNGVPYINIGTEEACLFVHISKQLIRILEKNPLLYFAVEEAVKCASEGYYVAGIMAYAQIFNCFNIETPEARHRVAHEFLNYKPTEEIYGNLLERLKYIAELSYINEVDKFDGSRGEFHEQLYREWENYISNQKEEGGSE